MQSSVFDPARWNCRVGVHAMYFKIACDQVKIYHARAEELSRLEPQLYDADEVVPDLRDRVSACYLEREQAAVIAVTFSAMALEAFFYDYAAERLGDQFVKEHLDKLDPKSKFLVFPRLVCGKQPSKSGPAYEGLKKLIALRNELVHFESRSFGIDELPRASEFHDELNERLRSGVDGSVESVLVLTELGALHGNARMFIQDME